MEISCRGNATTSFSSVGNAFNIHSSSIASKTPLPPLFKKQKVKFSITTQIPDCIEKIPKHSAPPLPKDTSTQPKVPCPTPHIIPLEDPSDKSENPRISTGLRQAQEILGKWDETIKFSLEPLPVHNSIGELGAKGT